MTILCGSSRHDMLAIISFRYQYDPFFIFCCISYVKLLDYWRAENFFSTSGAPRGPRPVAFAISATWLIRHWDRDKWRKYVNGEILHSLTDNYWQLVGTTYPRCSRPVWVRQPSRGAMFHRAKSCDRQTDRQRNGWIAVLLSAPHWCRDISRHIYINIFKPTSTKPQAGKLG